MRHAVKTETAAMAKEEGKSCSLKVRENIMDSAGYFQLPQIKDDHKHIKGKKTHTVTQAHDRHTLSSAKESDFRYSDT